MYRIWISQQLLWICIGVFFGEGLWAQDSLPLKPTRFFTIETTKGTYMNLDVSTKDGSIVFQLLSNIFIIGRNGGRAVQLTKGISWDSYPIFSPSGDQIAYISDSSGRRAVYIMDFNGQNKTYISDFGAEGVSKISWSSDGSILTNGHTLYNVTSKEATVLPPFSHLKFSKGVRYPLTIKDSEILMRKPDRDTLLFSIPVPNAAYRFEISQNLQYVALVSTNGNTDLSQNVLSIYETVSDSLFYRKTVGNYMKDFNHFAFDNDNNLIIGYQGKIHRICHTTGEDVIIPFEASIDMELASINRHRFRIPAKDSVTYTHPLIKTSRGFVNEVLGNLYISNGNNSHKMFPGFSNHQYYPVYNERNGTLYFSSWNDEMEGYIWKVDNKSQKPVKLMDSSGLYKQLQLCNEGDHLFFIKGKRNYGRFADDAAKGDLQFLDLKTLETVTVANDIPLGKPLESIDHHKIRFFGSSVKRFARYIEFNPVDLSSSTLFKVNNEVSFIYSGIPDKLVYVNNNVLYANEIFRDSSVLQYDHFKPKYKPEKISSQFVDRPIISNDSINWKSGSDIYIIAIKDALDTGKYPSKNEANPISLECDGIVDQDPYLIKAGKIITLDNGQIIKNGGLLISNGKISQIVDSIQLIGLGNIRMVDASDKVVMPGLIDVHAHDGPPNDILEFNWPRFKKALLFGITTERDPSATIDYGKYAKLSNKRSIMAPRLFGGRALTESRFDLNSYEDALAWVKFQKQNGSLFIKVHDIWNRHQRQWLVKASNQLGLNIIGHAEGEAFHGEFNLSMLLDGFVSWEHMIPCGRFYEDAISLIAKSQTYYILTGITVAGNYSKFRAYGKDDDHPTELNSAEIYKNINMDFHLTLPDKSPLRMYAKDVGRIKYEGGNIAIGSHGDIPGYEFHWELWAINQAGLDNESSLIAATVDGARLLGLEEELGSIKKGKIADLLILNGDPLEDIRETMNIHAVIKNGTLYYFNDFLE